MMTYNRISKINKFHCNKVGHSIKLDSVKKLLITIQISNSLPMTVNNNYQLISKSRNLFNIFLKVEVARLVEDPGKITKMNQVLKIIIPLLALQKTKMDWLQQENHL